jgi:hypothetical protein
MAWTFKVTLEESQLFGLLRETAIRTLGFPEIKTVDGVMTCFYGGVPAEQAEKTMKIVVGGIEFTRTPDQVPAKRRTKNKRA